jgi:CheY-like chemotaxis protein
VALNDRQTDTTAGGTLKIRGSRVNKVILGGDIESGRAPEYETETSLNFDLSSKKSVLSVNIQPYAQIRPQITGIKGAREQLRIHTHSGKCDTKLENAMQILAVDDDPIILELLEQFVLAIGGHEVTTAESGMAALELLDGDESGRFDCFLLDIQMPGMDGIELTRKIRDIARFADTPILMLTAMTDKRYIDAAFAAGATDYVTKPFEVSELKARITLVEGLVEARQSRTQKILATQSAPSEGNTIELYEPISIYDVDNVIEYMAMENYVSQLSRNALFGSTAFAFTIRGIETFYAEMTAFEFFSLVSDVAEVISDTLEGRQFLMSYAGNGTYVCITESGWRPESRKVMDAVNLSLATTELFDNKGNRVEPRVSAGDAVRLIWKAGSSVMEAVSTAHASAEAAAAEHEYNKRDFWHLGQTA